MRRPPVPISIHASAPRHNPPAGDEGDYIDIRDSDIIEPERGSEPVLVPHGDESVLAQTVLAMLESR